MYQRTDSPQWPMMDHGLDCLRLKNRKSWMVIINKYAQVPKELDAHHKYELPDIWNCKRSPNSNPSLCFSCCNMNMSWNISKELIIDFRISPGACHICCTNLSGWEGKWSEEAENLGISHQQNETRLLSPTSPAWILLVTTVR